MQTPPDPQPSLQQQYTLLLQQHQLLSSQITSLQSFLCKCYTIKKYPRILDLPFPTLQQSIAYKFNVQFQRLTNQQHKATQKLADEKQRVENKLNVLKEKQDKIMEEKRVMAVEKEKLVKRVEGLRGDVEEKEKKLEGARKRMSNLEQELTGNISTIKKLEGKLAQSEGNVKVCRDKIKAKQTQLQQLTSTYESKLKSLSQQLSLHKNKTHELQFQIKSLQQNIKLIELNNRKKVEELIQGNEKKVRETISGYEKEMERKKKEADTLYNSAVVRYEKMIKGVNERSEEEVKRKLEEQRLEFEGERERWAEYKVYKEDNENKLHDRIKKLTIQQHNLTQQLSSANYKISSLEATISSQLTQHTLLQQKLTAQTTSTDHQITQLTSQTASLSSQISKLLLQHQKQLKSQDQIYKQTIKVIQFDNQDKLRLLTIKLNEEKETIKNTLKGELIEGEQRHREEMQTLEKKFQRIKTEYQSIHGVYQNKFKASEKTYKEYTTAVNKRLQYQKQILIQLKDRQRSQMKTGYEVIITKYQKQFKAKLEEQKLLVIIEKDDVIEKQKIFYEEEIKSLVRSIEIAGNQKVLGIEKKVKFMEKKLRDLEVEHQIIVKEKEILNKTSNTQLEAMKELQEMFKEEIEKMGVKYRELEGKLEVSREEREQEKTRLMNEIEESRREFEEKEGMIVGSYKARIGKNEMEMKEFGAKMKQEFQKLEGEYHERYNILAKSYKELQFLSAQKVSLPEDIEIIKVLHKGVIEKEEELRKEKDMVMKLRKELLSKEQANRMFNIKKLDAMSKMNVGSYQHMLKKDK